MEYPVCEHGNTLVNPSGYLCCDACYQAFCEESNRRWIELQKEIRLAYAGIKKSYAKYVSVCGDPVQKDYP